MYYKQLRQYQKAEAITSSQLVKVAILLEHCAALLRQTKVALETKDYEKRFICTDKIIILIGSIQDCLVVDRSPEIMEIRDFFNNMISLIIKMNLKQDIELCGQLEVALTEMAAVWRLADSNQSLSQSSDTAVEHHIETNL